MLSVIETVFLRILRGTVIATAALALVVAAAALAYAAYAYFAPEPRPNLSARVNDFRQATDPSKLLAEVFPSDSTVIKDTAPISGSVAYESTGASDQMIVAELNKFLGAAFGASFKDEAKFADWLHGSDAGRVPFGWSKQIDDEQASNENNVNYLVRTLLLDYAKRLSVYGGALGKAKNQNLYPASFDRLVAPTGRARAPYFVTWFFDRLQGQLAAVDRQLTAERVKRDALRLTTFPALIAAGSAFGYFITIMFCFLFISMEASIRRTAQAVPLPTTLPPPTPPAAPSPPPAAPLAPEPGPA